MSLVDRLRLVRLKCGVDCTVCAGSVLFGAAHVRQTSVCRFDTAFKRPRQTEVCRTFHRRRRLFKVALVGTHGVNKTTIAYELAGVLKRKGRTVELLTEIARECPFPLNEQATREAYQWIIARQVQLEIEKSPRADVLVCDRSVLDNFAYYVRRYGGKSEQAEALGSYFPSWIKHYH